MLTTNGFTLLVMRTGCFPRVGDFKCLGMNFVDLEPLYGVWMSGDFFCWLYVCLSMRAYRYMWMVCFTWIWKEECVCAWRANSESANNKKHVHDYAIYLPGNVCPQDTTSTSLSACMNANALQSFCFLVLAFLFVCCIPCCLHWVFAAFVALCCLGVFVAFVGFCRYRQCVLIQFQSKPHHVFLPMVSLATFVNWWQNITSFINYRH